MISLGKPHSLRPITNRPAHNTAQPNILLMSKKCRTHVQTTISGADIFACDQYLLKNGGKPEIRNSYNKDAYDMVCGGVMVRGVV